MHDNNEIKEILFVEEHLGVYQPAIKMVYDWFHFNRGRVKIVAVVFGAREREIPIHANMERTILVRYIGDTTENPQACNHSETKEVIAVKPTCDQPGLKMFICKSCGMEMGCEEIPALGHTIEERIYSEGSCTQNGRIDKVCTRCNKIIESISTPKKDHNIQEVIIKQPTCSSTGIKETHCVDCGIKISSEEIPKIDHVPQEYITRAATCYQTGWIETKCSKCNILLSSRELPKLVHNPSERVVLEPTCTKDGLSEVRCDLCDTLVSSKSIPALGHDDGEEVTTVMATCLHPGKIELRCTRCGEVLSTRDLDQLDHEWIDNGDGTTHTCHNGCNVTEEHTPDELGDFCTKCGYAYPYEHYLHILTEQLSTVVYNTPFAQTLISTAPNDTVWSIVDGELPPGLTLNKDGNINGIPTSYGHYSVTVNAHYRQHDAQKTYEVDVADNITLNIVTDFITGESVGNAITDQRFVSNAPEDETTWCIIEGSIPPGLTFDPDTQIISGTPTTAGVYNFTMEVKYHDQTATKQFAINIPDITHVVTFNPVGGDCEETSRRVADGSAIGVMPTPTMTGKYFAGWYTGETGGLNITNEFMVTSDITLYARWSDTPVTSFGEFVTQFNIHVNNDRTNYNDGSYTLYARRHNGEDGDCNITFQTGITSDNGTNNMTSDNKKVTLYLKIFNNGTAGYFDVGFDCDSYVVGYDDDRVPVEIMEHGVKMADGLYTVTAPYETMIWAGKYSERTSHRYDPLPVGTRVASLDTGYALTFCNIFVNSNSYAIIEVSFLMT